MVSGLVTSPCDQLRIFSGEASEMRMESKSAIRLERSYGEERYMMSPSGRCPVTGGRYGQLPDISSQCQRACPMACSQKFRCRVGVQQPLYGWPLDTDLWPLSL